MFGSTLNIYTGWDFVGELNPISVYTLGWYDSTESELSDEISRVYTAGWVPIETLSVFTDGWFSSSTNNKIVYVGLLSLELDIMTLLVKLYNQFEVLIYSDDIRDVTAEINKEKVDILFGDPYSKNY